jgi:hypothetical protein
LLSACVAGDNHARAVDHSEQPHLSASVARYVRLEAVLKIDLLYNQKFFVVTDELSERSKRKAVGSNKIGF